MRTSALALLLLAALGACKEKQAPTQAPAAPPVTASAPPQNEPPRPSLPTKDKEPLGGPVTIEEARDVLPAIDGKEILPLKQTSDERQVHGTWCIDGDGADHVAREVGKAMALAGYTDLSVRGDARKAGVQGLRDGFRMSMVVSASSAATCQAPAHYFASATIYRD